MQKNNKFRNQQGFTLLESLLSFSIFLVIVFFVPTIVNVLHVKVPTTSYQVNLFFEYIHQDIVQAKYLSTTDNKLILMMDEGRVISYEKYSSNIRRQVDDLGNEILLQGVEAFDNSLVSNGVNVSIERDGKRITKRLSLAPAIF